MTTANISRLLPHLRRVAGEHETALPDEELLRRYLSGRDQSAFAALVQRHGAMVFAVSQSVLRQRHDAEDAFQTAFLILARKADTIRRHEGVGGWLHRVAYRVALKARANSARRQAREAKAAPPNVAESVCEDLTWAELRALLHAELAGLPERFREPLVLCYLEGLTQDEAAQRLGWTAATVKGRLQRGRQMLRRRLERRGVALSAVLGVALTGQSLAAPVSAALVETTLGLARQAMRETPTLATTLAGSVLRPRLPARAALSAVLLAVGLAWGVTMLPPKPGGGEPPVSAKPVRGQAQRTDLYGDPLPEGAVARLGSTRFRHAGLSDYVCLPGSKTVLTSGNDRVLRLWDLASGRLVSARPLQGKASPGYGVTLSPDGKLLTAFDKGRIVVWEVATGKELKSLPAPKTDRDPKEPADWFLYRLLLFSPDGKTLAVGRFDWQLSFWDWKTGKRRASMFLYDPRQSVQFINDSTYHGSFSPDGKWFVAGPSWNEPLRVFEVATGREVRRFTCHATISTVSPDSKRLAVSSGKNDRGGPETVVRLFDLASGKEVGQIPLGHKEFSGSLAFAPDGKTLACGFYDRRCLLDCVTGRVLHRLPGGARALSFSPDGKVLLANNTGQKLRLWDAATGKELQKRPGNFGWEPVTAASPDGRLLAAADGSDKAVLLWDANSGRLLRRLPLEGGPKYISIRNLSFSPDGKTLVAGVGEGFLQFWEVATGKEQRTLPLTDSSWPNNDSISFSRFHVSPDGKRVSTLVKWSERGKDIRRLALWDTKGRLLNQHALPPEGKVCAWAADGMTVALLVADGLTLMQVETGMVRFRIPGPSVGGPLAASPDGRLVAAPMPTGTVDVWETATGKEVATVAAGPVSHLALTPDNHHLVTAHEHLLRVWDLGTGKERRHWSLPASATLAAPYPWESPRPTRLLLSPDGERAFTALADGTALVWDLTPALLRSPQTENPDQPKLTAWWADLAAEDARRAYAAIWRLAEAPEATVPFLRRRLRPPTDAELKEVRRHIADLDSTRFATREQALERLSRLGESAEPVLRHALEKNPSLETRRRIQVLLTQLSQRPLSGAALRTLRALEVLEHTGVEGRRLLRELAEGVEDARLTREARASLKRLARRSP